jgi:hypothetical protein
VDSNRRIELELDVPAPTSNPNAITAQALLAGLRQVGGSPRSSREQT